MNFEKRMKEIEQRKLEIRQLLEDESKEVNLDELETELRSLENEKVDIEKRMKIAAGIAAGKEDVNVFEKEERRDFATMDIKEILDSAEYRSAYLKTLQGKELTDIEKRTLTTAVNSAGAAVPTTTLNKIIDKLRQTSALFPEITVSYIPGNLSLTVANAKNDASWKAEGTDGNPADDTVVSVKLGGYELIKLVEISAAAQAMSIDAFEAYITAELGRRMAIAIENAILNGDGDGEPTGILTGIVWDETNSVAWPTGSNLDYDTIVDAMALLPTLYHQNACFCMNRKTLFGQVRKIKNDFKEPIFAYNAQDRAAMSILGYKIVLNDYMPDDTITFCDPSYYYMNFSKVPEISVSREAGFKSGKITYRGLAVVDGKPALSEAFVKIYKSA